MSPLGRKRRGQSLAITFLWAQKIPIDQLVSAVGDIEANDYGTLHRNVTHEVNGKTITEHALASVVCNPISSLG